MKGELSMASSCDSCRANRQHLTSSSDDESSDDDYTIENVLKRGFTRSGRLLRAEEVVVRRFKDVGSTET